MLSKSVRIQIRKATDRFHSDHGWLDSFHTFSFGEHDHRDHRGFGCLRVINDDNLAPVQGFGTHPHKSMEIFSYVISGELEHKDSMGNGRTIKAGEFQYMSAGNGVEHSEFNPATNNPVHFLQIWMKPITPGGSPRYRDFDLLAHTDGRPLSLIASPDGRADSIEIRADGEIYFGNLPEGESVAMVSSRKRHWIHLISGSLTIEGELLEEGDGAAIKGRLPRLESLKKCTFFLFAV